MEAIIIILWVAIGYMCQMILCGIINIFNGSEPPNSGKDLLRKTFLPWLLINLKEARGDDF